MVLLFRLCAQSVDRLGLLLMENRDRCYMKSQSSHSRLGDVLFVPESSFPSFGSLEFGSLGSNTGLRPDFSSDSQ